MIKVHVISNINTDPEVYSNLRNILQSHAGPVQYYFPNEQTETQEEGEDKEFSDSKKFSIKWQRTFLAAPVDGSVSCKLFESDPPIETYSFPFTKKVHTWTNLFSECDIYRKRAKIPAEDHVILLTPEYNDSNWFGGADERGNNYFVHSVGWNFYLGGSAAPQFPIAYECAVWILRRFMFRSLQDAAMHFHKEPIGCMMDFCEDKKDISIKLRTADVCPDCLKLMRDRDVDRTLINQTMRIMDGIRAFNTFRQRFDLNQSPSRIEIKGHLKRIVLTDMGGLQLDLNPKERAVYLLFLNHPEGIRLAEIDSHAHELRANYMQFSNAGELPRIDAGIRL
ncbi:MAG: hypothetical protein ACKO66_04895, partial [Flavobacteriales bacterium]